MIKLVLFDLDGVLVSTKTVHFDALNEALNHFGYPSISVEDHLTKYDGHTTEDKLKMLGVQDDLNAKIQIHKQAVTYYKLNTIKPNPDIVLLFRYLKDEGYKIGVCSNAIDKTVYKCVTMLGLDEYVDIIQTSFDVENHKPHPQIWWNAMSEFGCYPYECVIIEDSPTGLMSAYHSGCPNVIRVTSPEQVNIDLLQQIHGNTEKPKWVDKKMNVLIPMAGAGSRFSQAGYTFPKPLIDVNGKPMIQCVVDNIGIEANYIFVVQKEHREKYNLDTMLNLIAPDCTIVEVNGVTEGAACTTLLAKEFIDNDDPLFIANSDQFIEWNPSETMYNFSTKKIDGGILTFDTLHPKWSYAKVDKNNLVTEVAEKKVISNHGTVGVYYWKKGQDFVKYAEQMIDKDIRVNNEFYVCPVFNEAIVDKKVIKIHNVDSMWGLGTPEDLDYYLKYYNKD
jgi:HAD superfamily hydrolase (TIGR01509 family)